MLQEDLIYGSGIAHLCSRRTESMVQEVRSMGGCINDGEGGGGGLAMLAAFSQLLICN